MQLKKTITKEVLLLLTINSVIGTGIFFLPAVAAGIAGPASILSWIAVSVIAILISTYFAELVSLFPKSGGVYEYAKNAFGELAGFLTGWISWIVANITIAMLIIGGLEYLSVIIPLTITQKIVIALLFVLGVNVINYRGIDFSVKALLFFALITVSIIWLLITWGAFRVDINNYHPFFVFPKYNLVVAMFLIIETFFGWETTTFLTEETKEPKKVVPKVLVLATIIIALLNLGLVLVSLGVVPWYNFAYSNAPTYQDYVAASKEGMLVDQQAPLYFLVSKITTSKVATIIGLFIFLNIVGAAASWIVSTPRLIFSVARDGLLPRPLGKVHEKYGTPHNAIILQTLLTSMIILSGSYLFLLKVLLPLAIIMYSTVLLTVSYIHFKNKKVDAEYKSPLPRIIPPILVIVLMYLMLKNTSLPVLLTSIAFVLMGIPLYVTAIMGYNKKIIRFFHELLAPLMFLSTKFTIKKSLIEDIVSYMSTQEKIVDFGCGVGVLSLELAKALPTAKIYGLDFSSSELAIAKEMKKASKVRNVEFYKVDVTELGKHETLNKELRKIDGAVSIALLGYLDDPVSFLKDVAKRMKKEGKVYFVEYDYVSQVWDKPWVESDKAIKEMFSKAGFEVKVKREKSLLWKYVHIYGIKK